MPPKLVLRRSQALSDVATSQSDKSESKNARHPAPADQEPFKAETVSPGAVDSEPTKPDSSSMDIVYPSLMFRNSAGSEPSGRTESESVHSQPTISAPATSSEASGYAQPALPNSRGFLVRIDWPSTQRLCDGLCIVLNTEDGDMMFRELLDGVRNHIFALGRAADLAVVDVAHTVVEWDARPGSGAPNTRVNRQNWPAVARTIADRGGGAVMVVALMPDATVRARPDLHSMALLFV